MLNQFQITKFENEIRSIGDALVIVEGIKDKKALSKIGIRNIFDISGKSFDEILEKVDGGPVIILTDFDEEGEKKALFLTKLFQSNGIKIDFFFRKKFRSHFKVQKIEELNSFIKLEDDLHGKIGSIYDKIFNRSRIFYRRNCRKTRHNRSDIWSD
jgi:5S rRNA maturation endonuclease (ribonuclease M5)